MPTTKWPKHHLSPDETRIMVTAASGARIRPDQFHSVVKEKLTNSLTLRGLMLKDKVNKRRLLRKLGAHSTRELLKLWHGIETFHHLPLAESMGHDGRPSFSALQRVDLVAPSGRAAWGLCVVRLDDCFCEEIVLREDVTTVVPRGVTCSVERLANDLLMYVEASRLEWAPPNTTALMLKAAYMIAHMIGLRHFSVMTCGWTIKIESIPVSALVSDFDNKSLSDLTLQGVNAPDRGVYHV